jgi:hypothetical protein
MIVWSGRRGSRCCASGPVRSRVSGPRWPRPTAAAAYGENWTREFARWAERRPTQGSLRDGWDLARDLGVALPASAAEELTAREVAWRYDGVSAPRPRRAPALRRTGGSVVFQIAGRVRTVRRG